MTLCRRGAVTLPDLSRGITPRLFRLLFPTCKTYRRGRAQVCFAGWYTDPDFSGSAITAIDGDSSRTRSLYANGMREDTDCYDFGGLESVDNPNPETIAISDLPFELLPATLAGYEFVGWYLDPDYSGEPVTSIPAGLTEGMALYGKFEVAP